MGTAMAGFDVHRAQITFDALEVETGELVRGRIDATREAVAEWVGSVPGAARACGAEACTGWFLSARRSRGPARWRIWPSRPRHGRGGARERRARRSRGRRGLGRMLRPSAALSR